MGDDGFGDFCRRYRGRIFGYVRAKGQGELSIEDIEDATQVTLMRLWAMWSRIDPDQPLEPLIFTIARRVVADGQRRRRAERRMLARAVTPDVADAADAVITRDDHTDIHRALAALSPSDRDMLVMRYWQEMSPSAIAQRTGVALPAVHQRTSRARRRCQDHLAVLRRGFVAAWVGVVVTVRAVRRQLTTTSAATVATVAAVSTGLVGGSAVNSTESPPPRAAAEQSIEQRPSSTSSPNSTARSSRPASSTARETGERRDSGSPPPRHDGPVPEVRHELAVHPDPRGGPQSSHRVTIDTPVGTVVIDGRSDATGPMLPCRLVSCEPDQAATPSPPTGTSSTLG
ncbi:sigma-70 family RNA polymerase sigma factor [Haloechinothrix salitolerans]|uniref:RNA polymerase sigma factor n=1 Tax=Haloechinothrix salitolerans TaxID=926830 RepID=A0ABW2BZV8_9PSEU